VVYHLRTKKMRRRARDWMATLNGQELRDCFYADPRRGVARTWVINPRTRQLVLWRGRPMSQEHRGRVRVRRRRPTNGDH